MNADSRYEEIADRLCVARFGLQGAHFFRPQFAILADLEVANRDWADVRAHQLEYFAVDGLKHAPDLAVASFANGQADEAVFLRIAHACYFRGLGGSVVQLDAVAQLAELFVAQSRGCLDQIGLRNLEIRIHDTFGELRVVGE